MIKFHRIYIRDWRLTLEYSRILCMINLGRKSLSLKIYKQLPVSKRSQIFQITWDHPFNTYAKVSEKLTFLKL